MFPPSFDYRRAGSVEEALDLLADLDDARPLAGGHSLLPALKTGGLGGEEVGAVVDVSGIDGLDGVTTDGDATVVGALTTYADLAADATLRERAPALADAAAAVGDRQIRNRGTVGGNLAAADRGADLPAAVLAAGATLRVEGPGGERTVDATEFFRGDGDTAVGGEELVTAVWLPGSTVDSGGAYVKKTHPASGYAMVGVGASVEAREGAVSDARVAATGVTDPPTRLPAVEDALVGESADAASAERAAADAEPAPEAPVGDVHASGEFRAELLPTFVERALTAAVERATGGATAGGAR